ncbi:unnamed protein product [Cuscuta campestris]|uniref:Retrotransposon gag domain-containing protein n=1 Tax=Cuscuta campestris TaxID=132261 RepID=A0A484LCE3_9ASTE|nr:unnamed protein product [Cuscuta campestris]
MGEPQIALDWLEQMDRVLKNLRVPDADRSELASQMFRKGAYDWWKRIDQDPHTPKPWTWDRFDRAFTKEYVPTRYREERRDEFVALKQEGMSLPELRQKFDYLSQYATSLVSTPEDHLNEFVKKLRPDLRPYVALITTTDFNAAYDLIVKTEKSLDDLQATKKEDRATKDPRPAPGRAGRVLDSGERGHFRRHCPTNPSSEPIFPRAPDQPATSHPARSQQSRAANNQQRPRLQQSGRAPARTYAMQGRTDPSPDVILGTFILFDSVMHALIDPGSMLSYICVGMHANSAIVRSDLEIPTVVSNPLGKQFPADLIELPHKEFDIILGMDWLTEHRAVVDCSCRTVRLRAEDRSDVSLSGEVFPKAPEFISSMSARRWSRKKCEMFLCHVQDMRKESPRQQDIRTVCDFPDVFPEDLPVSTMAGGKSKSKASKKKGHAEASSSPPQPFPYFDGSFLEFGSEEELNRFLTHFAKRPISPHRVLPKLYPQQKGYHELDNQLQASGLWPFVSKSRTTFNPAFVQAFYSNLCHDGDTIYSSINLYDIEIDLPTFARIAGLPIRGDDIATYGGDDWILNNEAVVIRELGITNLILHSGAPTIHSAPLEKRLLLYILTRILYPRDGSHTSPFNKDLKAIHALIHGVSINWAKFVIIHMADCASLVRKRDKPVFQHED